MKSVIEYIKSNDNIGVICHKSPDGDTLGSGLALYFGLKKLGKKCNIYCADKPSGLYSILDGIENIKPLCELRESNLIFCDCADENRADFTEKLSDYNILNIDHHISNNNFGNINYIKADACATCVIMYYVLTELGVELDKTIAKNLYVGICTDTNNFTNSNVNSESFYVASKIADFDFSIGEINKAMFRNKSYGKTVATARYIQRMRMFCDNKFCISFLTLKDLQELKVDNTEGIVNCAVDIDGVSVGAFLKEAEPNVYKVSLRSNYDVDVCKICEAFGGGGHIKASGCKIKGELEDVIHKLTNEVLKWME